MTIDEASEALYTALTGVEGIRAYRSPDPTVVPPAAVVGPPSLTFEAFAGGMPTEAKFVVWIVVGADARSMQRLWQLVPAVADAIWEVQDASVESAQPDVFSLDTEDLPAYSLVVSFAL